jgi:hypothetical protein
MNMRLFEAKNITNPVELERIRKANNWVWIKATKTVRFKGLAVMESGKIYLSEGNRITGIFFKKPEVVCTSVLIPGFGVCCTQINTVKVVA